MSFNLRNRSLLTVQDYTQREFRYLLDLAPRSETREIRAY